MNYHADMHYGNNDDYDEDNHIENMSSTSSSEYTYTSLTRARRKIAEDAKLLDKGYMKLVRHITINNNKKKVKTEIYKTPIAQGTRIRNAVSGLYDNTHVGKYDEDLYFKVSLCAGESGQDPTHLYYESPEQYEKHFLITVDKSIKEKWFQKYRNEQDRQDRLRRKKDDMIVH